MSAIVARRTWIFGTLALALLFLALALGGLRPAAVNAKDDATEPALADVMEAMGKDFGALRHQIDDSAKNAESLTLVVEMEGGLLTAKSKLPPKLKDQPADQQPGYRLAYKKQMIAVLTELLRVEQALLENRNADAATGVKTVADLMKAAHAKFAPKEAN